MVYSWLDMAPGSDFLHALFQGDDGEQRTLPDHVPHHLIFGFGNPGRFAGDSRRRFEELPSVTLARQSSPRGRS